MYFLNLQRLARTDPSDHARELLRHGRSMIEAEEEFSRGPRQWATESETAGEGPPSAEAIVEDSFRSAAAKDVTADMLEIKATMTRHPTAAETSGYDNTDEGDALFSVETFGEDTGWLGARGGGILPLIATPPCPTSGSASWSSPGPSASSGALTAPLEPQKSPHGLGRRIPHLASEAGVGAPAFLAAPSS